jgi:hypothetical protein
LAERFAATAKSAWKRHPEWRFPGNTSPTDTVPIVHQQEHVDDRLLQVTIVRVSERRATHAVPASLAPPPRELAQAYRREAEHLGIVTGLDESHQQLAAWIDPVLRAIVK